MTPRPAGSVDQPIMSIVFATDVPLRRRHVRFAGPLPVRKIAAAAPSPKSAAETISGFVARSMRNASVHNSSVTSNTVMPGSPAAMRAAVANPVTPPAQPKPKMGIRRTSGRKQARGGRALRDSASRRRSTIRSPPHRPGALRAPLQRALCARHLRTTRWRRRCRPRCVPAIHAVLRTTSAARPSTALNTGRCKDAREDVVTGDPVAEKCAGHFRRSFLLDDVAGQRSCK